MMVNETTLALKGFSILFGLLLAGPVIIVLVTLLKRLRRADRSEEVRKRAETTPLPVEADRVSSAETPVQVESEEPSADTGKALPAKKKTSVLWVRYLTLIGFTVVFLGTAFWGELPFFVFMVLVVCIGLWEFWRLLAACHVDAYRAFGWVVGVGLISSAYFWGAESLGWALMGAVVLILPLALFVDDRRQFPIRLGGTLLAVIYVALLGSGLVLLRGESQGLLKILFFYAVIQFADVFALLGGTAIGGPKMIPRISPGKTWAGTISGFVAAALGGLVFRFTVPAIPWYWVVAISLVLAFVGLLGDLVASSLKRAGGLKDFSHILPGHGGVLDRFDSILLTAPVAWVLLTLW